MMQLELFNNNPQTLLTEEKVPNIQAQTENVKKLLIRLLIQKNIILNKKIMNLIKYQ